MLDKDGSVAPSPQGVTASVKSKEETEQTLSKDVLNSDSHQAAAPAVLNNTDSSRQAGYLVAEGSYRNTVIVDGHRNDVKPDAIGRETCPICIVDFEEGDDLRVLPCKGEHRFHQACVDPWLLELSSSCPICREGEMMTLRTYSGITNSKIPLQISMRFRNSYQNQMATRKTMIPITSTIAACTAGLPHPLEIAFPVTFVLLNDGTTTAEIRTRKTPQTLTRLTPRGHLCKGRVSPELFSSQMCCISLSVCKMCTLSLLMRGQYIHTQWTSL